MAANSTVLAMQCAAGVVAPARSNLGRSMVTCKTHKTATAMAANPAKRYEAGALVSTTPCQLGENPASVTTKLRNKTIVGAFPRETTILSHGIPFHTHVIIENYSGNTITLDDKDIWCGERIAGQLQSSIDESRQDNFLHQAVSSKGIVVGSVAGLEYKLPGGSKWVIAWSNPINELNKVYTQIVDGVVDWENIKEHLEEKGNKVYVHRANELGFSAEVTIDPESGKPTMMAKINRIHRINPTL